MIHRSHRLHRSVGIICVICGWLFLSACRSQTETAATDKPLTEVTVSSTPPFQTKEPDRYRATRTVTIVSSNGETVATKTSIARDGDLRRQTLETDGYEMIYLDLAEGRFVLLPAESVYANLADETAHTVPDGEDSDFSPDRLLHSDSSPTSSYQTLGKEVIDGRGANKYRVAVNSSSAGSVSQSETLIWIDEALNMPIKSETTSPDRTRVTMQLSEIALEVDRTLFQIPEGYEKVTFKEIRKRLKKSE